MPRNETEEAVALGPLPRPGIPSMIPPLMPTPRARYPSPPVFQGRLHVHRSRKALVTSVASPHACQVSHPDFRGMPGTWLNPLDRDWLFINWCITRAQVPVVR